MSKTESNIRRVGKNRLTNFTTPSGSLTEKANSSFQTGFRQLLMTFVFAVWSDNRNKKKKKQNKRKTIPVLSRNSLNQIILMQFILALFRPEVDGIRGNGFRVVTVSRCGHKSLFIALSMKVYSSMRNFQSGIKL